jgi:hypothetical protein
MLVFLFLQVCTECLGQAVPDTSLKHPIPDSAIAEKAKVESLPNADAGISYQPSRWQPKPKKAGLYSAILPGAGQLYNRQYWKIPVVYVGVGAAVYFIKFNSDKYRSYRRAYVASLQGKEHEFTDLYDQAALKQLQDGYKRYLDMSVLFTVVGYTLQVIDAVVFSHLKNFDMSRDITLRVQPVAHPFGAGIGLVAHFK